MGTVLIGISLFIAKEVINITIPESQDADFKNDENKALVKERDLILQRKKGSVTWTLMSMILVFSFIETLSATPLGDGLNSLIYILFVKIVIQRIAVWKAQTLDDELIVIFVKGIVDISSYVVTFHLKNYSDMVLIFVVLMMYDAVERFLLGMLEKKLSTFFFKSAANESGEVDGEEREKTESDDDDDDNNKPVYNRISISLLYSMASNLQDIFILMVGLFR
jgi:hypothetical protein